MNHWLIQRLQKFENQTFLSREASSTSYAELYQLVSEYIAQFSNLEELPSKTIILNAPFSQYSVAAFLALFELNWTVCLVADSKKTDLSSAIEVTSACLVLSFDEKGNVGVDKTAAAGKPHKIIEEIHSVHHSGLILLSSGTTGEPKLMVHDLDQLLLSYKDKKPRKLRMFSFLLFDHIGGLNTIFSAIASGTHLVASESKDPLEVAKMIEQHKVQILPVSPTFLNLLLLSDAPALYDLSSLKIITYGTEPMPLQLLSQLRKAFPKTKLIQTFGTSETGIIQSISRSSESLDIRFNDPQIETKVVQNELWIRSKTQVLGYLNAPMEAFTEDGWYKTGDLVESKDDGYLRIIGRKSDVINVGGEKVMPQEVESLLLSHEAVEDALVYGKKHPITGQVVAARIKARRTQSTHQCKRDIQRFCRKKTDAFKVPVYIEFIDELCSTGSIKKQRIQKD